MSVTAGPMNTAANLADNAMGEHPEAAPTAHNANPANDPEKFAEPGSKMRALVFMGKNDVQMADSMKPKLVNDHDVILKITGSTVCGSDLHLYHGSVIEMQRNDILGHEFMGIVDQVGSAVGKIKPGDRVVASFNIACGKCFMCEKKLSSQCQVANSSSLMNTMYGNRTCGMFGYSHFTGGFAGGQAEYTRVPWGDANLLKIPKEVPDEAALYLSDILCTSYHCVVDSGVKQGDIVAIWGAGAIGVMAAKWSFLKGAKRVIVIDSVQWRLDYMKKKMPEIETVNFAEVKDIPAKLNEMTSNGPNHRPPGVDVALECAAGEYAKSWTHKLQMAVGLETDSSEILNEMIASVVPFGTVGITGLYAGLTNGFNIGAIMQTGIRFIGNGQAPVHKYWSEILENYLVPKKIDVVDLIVTHRIPLEDTAKCYKKFDERNSEDAIMKVFVETQFSSPPSEGAPRLSNL